MLHSVVSNTVDGLLCDRDALSLEGRPGCSLKGLLSLAPRTLIQCKHLLLCSPRPTRAEMTDVANAGRFCIITAFVLSVHLNVQVGSGGILVVRWTLYDTWTCIY